jgi:hypothetical protein
MATAARRPRMAPAIVWPRSRADGGIAMDIELSAADLAFRADVRTFLAENAFRRGDNYITWRANWFARAREKGGWDVPRWPAAFGGPGWTPTQHYIWEQETARAQLPLDTPFGVGMLAPILMAYGSPEQQARFLPGIRARTVSWCQGYSEPGAGSDLASLKTRAVRAADGSHYVVDGTKVWTTLAHMADWMFCLVRTATTGRRQEGITFLLIDMKTPGIEVKPIITLGGAHTVNMVHLTGVVVPAANRVGEEGKGWTYAKGLLEHERTGLAGISRSIVALERLKEQARSVTHGSGTLLDEPLYRARVARVEIELAALEFTELRSLSRAAAGQAPGPESSILKLKGTEIQQRIQKLAVDAAGPHAAGGRSGPRFAAGVMGSYLGGRATTIYGGASEVQKDVIARNVLGIRSGAPR